MPKKPKAQTPVRTEFSAEEITAKTSAGLTRAQALEVLQTQAAHDATDPHDEPPKAEEPAE